MCLLSRIINLNFSSLLLSRSQPPVYLYMKILNELRDAESLFLPHKTEKFPLFFIVVVVVNPNGNNYFLHDNVQSYDNSIVLVSTRIAHISFMYFDKGPTSLH